MWTKEHFSKPVWLGIGGLILLLAACGGQQAELELLPSPEAEETQAVGDVVTPEATAPASSVAIATPAALPERDTDEAYSNVDRPDDVQGYQVHFIYALPADGEDGFLDVDGTIELSAGAMNHWLEGRTEGARLRYDRYEGQLDISFMRLDYSAEEISSLGTSVLTLMDHEIKRRGFDTGNKLYVVYYDGQFVSEEGYCGLASYPPDGWGVTAVLLLRAYIPRLEQPCPRQFTQSADFTGYFEMTILHEVLHLLGMAPSCGNAVEGGHVLDSSQDLMYASYDGSYSPIYTYLDENHNDYFGHGIEGCPDFARSAFLEPLPENAELPPAWENSSSQIPANPLEATDGN